MKEKVCCFIGHQKIKDTPALREKLRQTLEGLIADEGFTVFLFGSMSEFYPLCYEILSEIKEKYPRIRRIYVRSEYPYISAEEKERLLTLYEDTYYCKPIRMIDKADYVERNRRMIADSQVCIAYVNPNGKQKPKTFIRNGNEEPRPSSGTMVAYNYALKKEKRIINLFEKPQPVRKKPARRKPGTGSMRKLKSGIWKGSFSPTGANGKRITASVQAPTRQECEEKLALMVKQLKAEIAAEKASLAAREAVPLS